MLASLCVIPEFASDLSRSDAVVRVNLQGLDLAIKTLQIFSKNSMSEYHAAPDRHKPTCLLTAPRRW